MSEKVFDRLDLLSIFSESGSAAKVGSFRGWKTTDERGEPLREPQPVIHEVFANIAAFYCEKGGFAIIRRTVSVSQDYRLSDLRDELPILSIGPVWDAVNNVATNADLMRRVVDTADGWRSTVVALIPDDLPKPPEQGLLALDEDGAPDRPDGVETFTDGEEPPDPFEIIPHHPND